MTKSKEIDLSWMSRDMLERIILIQLRDIEELEARGTGGRNIPPHEFSQMVNALRDVPAVQSKREKIVTVLRAFNIRARHP